MVHQDEMNVIRNTCCFDGKAFVNGKQIIGLLRGEIERLLPPSPVPVVSDLALRKIDGTYYLATFIYFYTINDLIDHQVGRPRYWVLADMVDGHIIKKFTTQKVDFTLAPYNQLYSMKLGADACDVSREYYQELYKKLDEVRLKYLEHGEIDFHVYQEYLQGVIRNMPVSYADIFRDLSDLTEEKRLWRPSVAEGA